MREVRMTLFVVAFVLLLPVIFPVVAVFVAVDGWRLRAAARRAVRAGCGAVLGVASVDRARAETAARMAALRRAHPGVRFRTGPQPEAVCVACGQGHRRAGRGAEFVAFDA